jgi:fructose-bisphosphate aldolase class II
MPLVHIAQALARAQQEHYAIPLFDTFDMHSTDGMFQAMEAKSAPVIVAIYESAMDRPNARALAAYIRARAEHATVPVSLMLDHGTSFEQCIKAISYGFTDVMYDGSRLPLEENIRNTRAVVRAAHAVGIGVEAELGLVGRGSAYEDLDLRRKGFTDPDTVEEFVAQTGVDFLAIAIGTAHGLYDGEPDLDLDLLREIRSRVELPLVLHGGSGCTDDQFREVIQAGISKINVATDLYATTGRRLVEATKAEGASYFQMTRAAVESFQERCGHYLDLFGASGKA